MLPCLSGNLVSFFAVFDAEPEVEIWPSAGPAAVAFNMFLCEVLVDPLFWTVALLETFPSQQSSINSFDHNIVNLMHLAKTIA